MSEPIKYTYRGFFGFFVFFVLLFLTIIGGVLLVGGIAVVIFSWLPFIFPEFLETYRITFLSERITDPSTAFILFFATGITLLSLSFIILGFDYYIYRAVQFADQDISRSVDSTLPSIRKFFSAKGKAVFILIVLLFGTFVVILGLLV